MVQNPPARAGDVRDADSIPESGRSPGEGHGNPLQYSYLENPVDKGAWQAAVHRVTESDTTEVTKQYIYIYNSLSVSVGALLDIKIHARPSPFCKVI